MIWLFTALVFAPDDLPHNLSDLVMTWLAALTSWHRHCCYCLVISSVTDLASADQSLGSLNDTFFCCKVL